MRYLRIGLMFTATAVSGGCFQMTDVLKLNGDGTGTIEHRMTFTATALKQMRQLQMIGGGRGAFDPTSEKQARDLAVTIGTGVTYVSSGPIQTATGEGRESTYAFSDVNQLGIATQPAPPDGVSIRAGGLTTDSETIKFTLTHEPNGNAVLHIHTPPPTFLESIRKGAAPNQFTMIRQMLAGAQVLLTVEPAGTIVRTR